MAPIAAFTPASAQGGEQAYIVNDVKVDTLAESAVKARDKAFGEAQMTAFKMLAARFYSPEQMAGFKAPDTRTVAGMVQDFEVVNEQLSTKRYMGTYIFRFKAHAVNRYFGSGPQYFEGAASEARTRAGLLILPFFQFGPADKPATVLWDVSKNAWLRTWRGSELGGNPALILPTGDSSDVLDIRDGQPLTYNPAGLKRMMTRYEARDAVILLAKFTQNATPPLTVEIYRTDRGAKPQLHQPIPVPAGRARVLSELLAQGVTATKNELAGNWKLQTIVEDAVPAMDAELAADPSVTVNPLPQAQPQPYTPAGGQVRVQTRFGSLNEWLAIRRSLNTVPALTNVRIVALKANEAVVDLNYADWASLNQGLNAKGLSLTGAGAGTYQLTGRPASPAYR